MAKELIMGNAAIAFGAIKAGVTCVAGYPGTPSTEVLETVAKNNTGDIYVEWSVNEKAALEVAAGAAYSGARVMVTMKQVGLNVASDPLMCLNYVGIKGGMVVVVADDPGPISSQTEQDTRHFANYANLMVFDPSSPKEAYEMIQDAFAYSEQYQVPVLFRPTTRVCHGYQTIEIDSKRIVKPIEGFVKDPKRWVIFPALSYNKHKQLEANMVELSKEFSVYRFNRLTGSGKRGIITGGISYEYVMETIKDRNDVKVLKIATANPFPEELALQFLDGLTEVLAVEELDPFLEKAITYVIGKHHLPIKVYGKLTSSIANAGENTVEAVAACIHNFFKEETDILAATALEAPELPVRPPVLCAGCPHRASFYAVKRAMEGRKANFAGDIGCYTLGNAQPLNMTDTCLCMGADVTIAQGLARTNPGTVNFAFIGDSTFFASGMTGVVNAVYNEADMILCVLDNSTTAMTGHQPHPGTGVTMMGNVVDKIKIEPILTAIGVKKVITVDPLNLEEAIQAVKEVANLSGVKAIIFKSPCIAIEKSVKKCSIDKTTCINCKKCIRELGCPAIVLQEKKVAIEPSLCTGCGLCTHVCPVKAIGGEKHE